MKFRQIGHTTSQYGQSFFPKTICAWNGLAFAEAPSLAVFRSIFLQNGLESGNNKPFWKYVKSPKQETFGISALKSNGNVITDSLSKAEILNSQFKSVFTPQSGNTFPQLPGTQFPKIKPLHISGNGVFMLLDRIDVSKSSGPDKLPGRLLQSLAKEITPVVHFIFTRITLYWRITY